MARTNEYGQPVGDPVPDWEGVPLPDAKELTGRYCRLELLNPDKHADDLYDAYSVAPDGREWTYLSVGPFLTRESYRDWVAAAAVKADPRHYAVIDLAIDKAVGTLSLMRHDPANGVIEVGWVTFSQLLQRTPASTEAQYLLMAYVFDTLGYRRYEWKCDSLNAPSRSAALRLGFQFEGTFRNHVVYKGRSRDTMWFSITAPEWPKLKQGFEHWLDPANFDEDGRQFTKLHSSLR